ncbi:Uncharacterised protein [Acinetobacter baumannii]|nr:Uncharacterised protein [Acinetobacter baumannii]
MATLDDFRHLAVEEGQQQRTDVRTVDVGIGHDDDAVVTQLVRAVLVAADAATQRGDQRRHFLRREHFVETRFLDVEDFPLQRQDSLILAVAPLLGRAARGVPFHQVQFGQRRIAFLAVRQLARQAGQIQRAFAAGHLTRFTRRFARARRVDDFANHDFRVARILHQVIHQLLVHQRFNRGFHLGRDQLVLGLRRELRIRHLHRHHGDQAFTRVIAGGADFGLLAVAFLLHVAVQRTGHRGTETNQVRAAVALRNVVGEAVDVFLETVVPLQRHFYADVVFHGGEVEHVRVDRGFVLVQVLDKRLDAAFVMEVVFTVGALVLKANRHAGVEEGQLAQTLGQNVVLEFGHIGEGLVTRPEAHHGAGLLGFAHHVQRRLRLAVAVSLFVHFAFAADHQLQFLRQGVNHRDAHAVQAAGNFIGVVVEFTAGVQHGHDDLCG